MNDKLRTSLQDLIDEHGEYAVRGTLADLTQSWPTTFVSYQDIAHAFDVEEEAFDKAEEAVRAALTSWDIKELADKVGEGDMDSYWMALRYAVEYNYPDLAADLEALGEGEE